MLRASESLRFSVLGFGLGFRVQDFGFRVEGRVWFRSLGRVVQTPETPKV